MTLTARSATNLRASQREMERAMFGVSFRDQIYNVEIRRRTGVIDLIKQTFELKKSWIEHVLRVIKLGVGKSQNCLDNIKHLLPSLLPEVPTIGG